jgi:hypothetical protein
MNWVDDSRLHEFADGRLAGHLPQHWKSLQGMHGGLVAALAVRAADKHVNDLGAPTDCTLRAATFGFVRGSVAGEVIPGGRAGAPG